MPSLSMAERVASLVLLDIAKRPVYSIRTVAPFVYLESVSWRGFDAAIYARRNVVKRCVNSLEQWRGIATRYYKRALDYRVAVVAAALIAWLPP